MNELQEKFGDQGLSVLGVTGESVAMTTPWVEKHGMQFAFAYDKTGRFTGKIGKGGLPNAALIDAAGTLVWRGHPASLDEATIAKALETQPLSKPLFELAGFDAVREPLALERYDRIYEALDELEAGDAQAKLTEALELVIDKRIERVERMMEAGDFLAVQTKLADWGKVWNKLPQEARVDVLAKGLKDRDVKKVLRAQERVRDLVPEKARIAQRDRERIAKQLRKIIEDHPDTAAARDAEAALDLIGA